MRIVDLQHLGQPQVIGAWVVDDTYLIDPGPAICLPHLLAELGEWQPQAILVTHIHLDHSGVVGHLLQRWPQVEVWVHQRGAPHLADPTRLLASAYRVYGDQLEPLWGLPLPASSERLHSVSGGERIGPFEVLYTPGHASHHVAFLNRENGVVFSGDVTGVRIAPSQFVLPPTVPPETDISTWQKSLQIIRECQPAALALPHFGLHQNVEEHLEATDRLLEEMTEQAAKLGADQFEAWLNKLIEANAPPTVAASYKQAGRPNILWGGLRRYLDSHN